MGWTELDVFLATKIFANHDSKVRGRHACLHLAGDSGVRDVSDTAKVRFGALPAMPQTDWENRNRVCALGAMPAMAQTDWEIIPRIISQESPRELSQEISSRSQELKFSE